MKRSDEDRLGVALLKECCPLCGLPQDGPIILNKHLTPSKAAKVKKLHGKVIGFSDDPCIHCKELMSKGFLLIGVVDKKSGNHSPEEIYRSGNQWVITQEAAERMFPGKTSKGVAFIDVKVAHRMGFPNVNLDA
jgi:hypothetical protein